MDVLLSKVIALVLLCLLTLVFGLAPAKLYAFLRCGDENKCKRKIADLVVSCLLYFGGGVLMSTSFLHMVPEVRENVLLVIKAGVLPSTNYPIAELFVCLGFFIIYAVELVAHMCVRHKTAIVPDIVGCKNQTLAKTKLCTHDQKPVKVVDETSLSPSTETAKASYGSVENVAPNVEVKNSTTNNASDQMAVFRSSLVVAALSFHSIFEGMAVGLQPTSTEVWTLFTAIAIHKLVIAFCVGVELMAIGTKFLLMVVQIVIFAIVTPIGVGLGITVMASTTEVSSHALVIAVFQGIAAGTLLYVTFFEIFLKDKEKEFFACIKLACCFTGFAVIAAVQVLE